jgi:hypothetical protein
MINENMNEVDESVSYRGGFNYEFIVGAHQISVCCSSFSGKESIYVDGELVVTGISFHRKSFHDFSINDDHYEVELNVVDMLKGETHCTLIKNDVHVKTIKKALLAKNQLSKHSPIAKLYIIIAFIFGAASGYYLVKFLLSVFGG